MEEEPREKALHFEFTLQTAASFYSKKLSIETEVLALSLEGNHGQWVSCRLLLKTDAATYARLEQNHFFGNRPEKRLETPEMSFSESLPVFFEIELRPEKLALLPPPESGDAGKAVASLSGKSQAPGDLFCEESWHALQVWQEHHLDPSIGGGSIRAGYRTIWSPPSNEIDRLKRQGNVSRTVVEAFIENGLPVRFDRESEAFELALAVGSREYPCYVRPHDQENALSVEVELPIPVPDEAEQEVSALLERINAEILPGRFELEAGTVHYRSRIRADGELLNHDFVLETLRAGVTMMHHNAPHILQLLGN